MFTPVYRIQLVREGRQEVSSRSITCPAEAAAVFHAYLRETDRETFVLMGLTTRNRVIGLNTVSIGSLDCAIVHVREVFKPALLMSAASILVAHNHPSGDLTISAEDVAVTTRLVSAGELLGIPVLDHLILGENGSFVSLKQAGKMDQKSETGNHCVS